MLPATIGPYRMLRRLGEGGMRAVYEAIHETIERRVAIKLLHAEYAQNPDVMARFFNEARAVNRIDHPSLVQVSDYGRLSNGVAYIVMEFLKGESLGSRIRSMARPLPVAQTLQIALQIADALTAAHEKGIVHRDLKPDNVMIVPDAVAPGGERTKLLDFGIAKLAEEAQPGRPRTRVDAVMGTPHYIAPEQCRKANAVDDKADVYSLGVMLYQMLCGRLPFDGEGAGEILAKHLYEQPPALQSLAHQVSPRLAAFVHALLAKEKVHRPPMREVFAELGRMLSESGPAGEQTASTVRLRTVERPLARAHPSTLGLSNGQNAHHEHGRGRTARVGLSLLLISALAGGAWLSLPFPQPESLLQAPASQPVHAPPVLGAKTNAGTASGTPSNAETLPEADRTVPKQAEQESKTLLDASFPAQKRKERRKPLTVSAPSSVIEKPPQPPTVQEPPPVSKEQKSHGRVQPED